MELTPQQRDHFRTFGFLVLRALLPRTEIADLRAEVVDSLRANYTMPDGTLEVATGTDGYFLPMMGEKTPVSRALVADPRLVGVAQAMLDGPVAPKPAKGILYRDASFWHQDTGDPNLPALKLVTYLDPLTGPSGALQVLPSSHRIAVSEELTSYRARWPWDTTPTAEAEEEQRWPGLTLHSEPGDVIIFDVRLWHASLFGRDRLQWSVSYVRHPNTEAERDSARSYILSYLSDGHVYDSEAYPYLDPAWETDDGPFAATLRALSLTDTAAMDAVRSEMR
jgi:hypothetical protein